MAPSFLSKLVRATSPTHSRDRSDRSVESPRTSMSPKTRSRAPSTTIPPVPPLPPPRMPSPNGATDPKSSSRPDLGRIPTFFTTAPDDGGDSDSTFPSVTVVPPSPLVRNSDLSPNSSNQSLPGSSNGNSDRRNDGLPSTNGSTINSNSRPRTTSQSSSKSTHSINEDNLPTPTATSHPRSPKPKPPSSQPQSRSRPVTPSSSAGNLREKANKQKEPPASPSMPSKTLDPPYEVRKKPSNRSINHPPPPISISHARAATTPAPRSNSIDDQDGQATTYTSTKSIVESPTGMGAPEYPTPPVTSLQTSPNGISNNNSLLSPMQRDPDSASIISTNTTNGAKDKDKDKDKKRPWRRNTATRKPTGLASAIAASGLAIANHSLTPAQQAQFTAAATAAQQVQQQNSQSSSRKFSNPGSPPYTSSIPSTSTGHFKNRSAELSPKSNRSVASRRRTATSIHSDNASEYYGDDRPEYYSGLEEGSSDDDSSGSDDDLMDLDLGEDDIPVTGFAVASNKRNADFHELFPSVPEGDYLIEDYGCALQREILIQGRLYISENHICFHANIFGWITDLSLPINEITHLEKKMTAFVIPNAIQITTRQAKYTFASFLSRDTTYDVVHNIWKLERPDDASISSGRGSYENPSMDQVMISGAVAPVVVQLKKATQCACGREGKHFSETAMETVLPGTPDRIYNLIFASGFIKDFMAVNQKLLDIQISDWTPTAPDSKLLARNMSYIKPLNGSLGPKQTKCEIRDETVHIDFEDYVSTVTTTRTPDVPSGGVFSVKTRTCITWAGAMSTKVVVTTQVEWTGRSFIKGIIERSAIDGQKVYHADLETAMRGYIKEHQSEFVPEGVDPAVITLAETTAKEVAGGTAEAPGAGGADATEEERKLRERERNQRGLQWAWDTFEGASEVAKRSTRGALELIRDGWEQSSSTTILYFVIVILVLSNLWTLMRMGSREEAGRRKERGKAEERERWVQGVVTALRDELGAAKGAGAGEVGGGLHPLLPLSSAGSWREEVGQLQKTLDAVESRVHAIRESLKSVEDLNSQD